MKNPIRSNPIRNATARSLCLGVASMIAGAPAGMAAGDPPPVYECILDDLSRVTGELVDLDARSVRLDRGRGEMVELPTSEVLAVRSLVDEFDAETSAMWLNRVRVRPGLVRLTDGQRYTGTPSMLRSDAEVMGWDHPVLGLTEIPLERIDRVQQNRSIVGSHEPPVIEPATTADVLLLTNGDRIEGFVTEIGAQVGIETDGAELRVQINDVDQIALANAPESLSGPVIWMRDGSVLAAPGFEVTGGLPELTGAPEARTEAAQEEDEPGRPLLLEPDAVLAFVFDAARLVPLSSLERTGRVEIGGESAAFNAEPIRMRRPTVARFDLPEGASWLSLRAELPRRARTWGHARLTIAANGRSLESVSLRPDAPSAEIRVPLGGTTELEVRLEPDGFGPVQVSAELLDALVAVDR